MCAGVPALNHLNNYHLHLHAMAGAMAPSYHKTTVLAVPGTVAAEHVQRIGQNGQAGKGRVTRLYPRWRGGCCPCFPSASHRVGRTVVWRRFNLRRLRFRHPDGELTKLGFPRGPLVRQRYSIGDYLAVRN